MVNKRDITGLKVGRLIAIEPTDKKYGTTIIWKWKCECGNIIETTKSYVEHMKYPSCGCWRKEIRETEG